MSVILPSSFLRQVLLADAIISGATGLALFGGTSFLASLFTMPEPLLRYSGLFLLPYAAFIAYLATRASISRVAMWAVISINALWAIDSIVLLVSGWVAPNALGYAFVLFQAVAVAVFAELQFLAIRRSALKTT